MFTIEYQITVKEGPSQGRVYPLNAPSLTIGRDPMSDIVLSDPEVSRYHARLTQAADGGYKIEDMKSTNSTHIDGVRLGPEPFRLEPGQTVLFGSTVALSYGAIDDADKGEIAETMMHSQKDVDAIMGSSTNPLDADDIYAPSLPQTSEELPPAPPPTPADVVEEAETVVEKAEVVMEEAETEVVVEDKRPYVANEGIIEPEIPRNNKNRNIAIGVSATLFLLCCCCIIVPTVMYFWLGDLMLESMGLY